MPSDVALIEADKRAQIAVRNAAVAESRKLWKLLDPRHPFQSAAGWGLMMLDMLERRRAQSATASLNTYNAIRPAEAYWHQQTPTMDEQKVLRSLLVTGPGRIEHLVNQGLTVDQAANQAFKLNARSVSSTVLDSGRDLITEAVEHDQTALGYGRMPSADACAFCLMLASRGAVYSEYTVLTTTGRSTKRGSGKSYHEGCKCTAYPIFSEDQEVPDRVKLADQIYIDNSEGAKDLKEILRNIRKAEGVR